jgi:hypothetical protein
LLSTALTRQFLLALANSAPILRVAQASTGLSFAVFCFPFLFSASRRRASCRLRKSRANSRALRQKTLLQPWELEYYWICRELLQTQVISNQESDALRWIPGFAPVKASSATSCPDAPIGFQSAINSQHHANAMA